MRNGLAWILCFLFIARVLIPTQTKVYDNVESVTFVEGGIYRLTLKNGKIVSVPSMWTVIEEK